MSIPSGTLLQRYSNKRKQTNYLDIIFHRLTLNNAPLSMTAPVAFVRQKKGHPPIFPIILHSFSYRSLIGLLSENAEILYTSAFHASKIRVTTESERSQNGVRTEPERQQEPTTDDFHLDPSCDMGSLNHREIENYLCFFAHSLRIIKKMLYLCKHISSS